MNALSLYTAKPRAPEWCALVLIIILSAVLRLQMPGVVEFKRDEANLSVLALNVARGRDLPLLGLVSSIGVKNAPFNIYIMVPPYLISGDPVLATQYIGLLNIIGVLLTYALARRYYNPMVAIIAGLAFAVGPWAVIYSRKIWAQDMLPVFVVMVIGTGFLGFLEGKRWAQLLHVPLLAITGQIHYATIVLIPISLYLIFLGRRRLGRVFVFGIIAAALTFVPFLVGAIRALIPVWEMLPQTLSSGASGASHPLSLTFEAFQSAITTLGGNGIYSAAGSAVTQYLESVPAIFPLLDVFAVVVLASGGWLMVRAIFRRDQRTPCDLSIALWLFCTPLLFSVTWAQVQNHYMIPIFPAAFMALGIAFYDLWQAFVNRKRARQVLFSALGVGVGLILVLQVWVQVALLIFVGRVATPGSFGAPLGMLRQVHAAISAQQPTPVLVQVDGQDAVEDENPSVWAALLYDLPQVRFVPAGIDVYPAKDSVLLTQDCDSDGQVFRLRPLVDDSQAVEGCFSLRQRKTADFNEGLYTKVNGSQGFVNGVALIGYQWEPQSACLTTLWRIDKPELSARRSDRFSLGLTLVDSSGQSAAKTDAAFWWGRYWQAGDRLTQRACFEVARTSKSTAAWLNLHALEIRAEGKPAYVVDALQNSSARIELPLIP